MPNLVSRLGIRRRCVKLDSFNNPFVVNELKDGPLELD